MKVGQKVVCIDGVFGFRHGETCPVEGEIYTIREIYTCLGLIGLRLVEITNQPRQYDDGFVECGFIARQFRPIDESFGEKVAEKIEKHFIFEPEPVKHFGE